MNNINKYYFKGFMGKTHALLSLVLLFICMLIPVDVFQQIFGNLKQDWLLFIVGIITLAGGALLPDLDNSKSVAQGTLGPLGSIFTLFMQTTSSVVWTLYHFRGDRRPPTQHRYLWHTPIIGIGLVALFYFGLPNGNYTIATNISNSIKTGQFLYFLQTNAVLLIFIILMFMAILVGSNIIIGRINKLIHLPGIVKYALPLLALIYIAVSNYAKLRVLGILLGVGYLFHCLEDFFCDSSIPLIWPIPAFWKKQVWWKPKLPLTVKTGSTVNTIIDVIAGFLVIILLIIVIKK